MSLTIGGHNGPRIAEIKSVTVHGQHGAGCYVLFISLKALTANYGSKAYISNLTLRALIDPTYHLGFGVKEGSPLIEWGVHTADSHIGFYLTLQASQVEQIEKIRGLGDLNLSLWLSGITHTDNGLHDFATQRTFTVSKQEWLQALNNMGYRDTLLFELPMPKEEEVGTGIRVMLTKAKTLLENGLYEECVAKCRSAIELLEEARNDKNFAQEAGRKYKGQDRKEMSVNERMLFLREVVKNITHLGNHPNPDSFSRSQAQSVLAMTVAILGEPEVGLLK